MSFNIEMLNGMIFLWTWDEKKDAHNKLDIQMLPFEMNVEQATQFAWDWLKSLSSKELGKFNFGEMAGTIDDFARIGTANFEDDAGIFEKPESLSYVMMSEIPMRFS